MGKASQLYRQWEWGPCARHKARCVVGAQEIFTFSEHIPYCPFGSLDRAMQLQPVTLILENGNQGPCLGGESRQALAPAGLCQVLGLRQKVGDWCLLQGLGLSLRPHLSVSLPWVFCGPWKMDVSHRENTGPGAK